MSQILIALSVWLHALGTVILIGHYLLLSVIYLPVLEKNGGAFLSEISKQVKPTRTALTPLIPRWSRLPSTARPCGSRMPDLGVTLTA